MNLNHPPRLSTGRPGIPADIRSTENQAGPQLYAISAQTVSAWRITAEHDDTLDELPEQLANALPGYLDGPCLVSAMGCGLRLRPRLVATRLEVAQALLDAHAVLTARGRMTAKNAHLTHYTVVAMADPDDGVLQ